MTNKEAVEVVREYMRNEYGEEKIRVAKNMAIEALQQDIVYCYECKYKKEAEKDTMILNKGEWFCKKNNMTATLTGEDYCSYGERKESEEIDNE